MCVVSPLPETYLFGTRPRVQAQKTFFDIRPNSTHVRPQRICLVPLLSSPVPTHAYLSIFHPSLSSTMVCPNSRLSHADSSSHFETCNS